MPDFLIDLMNLIRSIFTLNVPGLMSSPACASSGTPMSPLAKWYLSLCFPVALSAVFPVGTVEQGNHRLVVKHRSAGQSTWLFSFQSVGVPGGVDCTGGTEGALILDHERCRVLSTRRQRFPSCRGAWRSDTIRGVAVVPAHQRDVLQIRRMVRRGVQPGRVGLDSGRLCSRKEVSVPPRYGPVVGDLCGADKDAGHRGIDHDVCSESYPVLLYWDECTAVVAVVVWPSWADQQCAGHGV